MFKVPFLEPCPSCGGFVEIETMQTYLILNAKRATIGDTLSCSLCQCTGVIDIDADGNFCNWNEVLCESCLLAFDKRLDVLTERILEMARG